MLLEVSLLFGPLLGSVTVASHSHMGICHTRSILEIKINFSLQEYINVC